MMGLGFLAFLAFGFSLIFLLVGMGKPGWVLRWGQPEAKTRGKIFRVFGGAAGLSFVVFVFAMTFADSGKERATGQQPAPAEVKSPAPAAAEPPARASAPKRPLPSFKVVESFDLAPYKWQVTLLVPRQPGGQGPVQTDLEALARQVAQEKTAKLGKVDRWWVSFTAAEQDQVYYADVHYDRTKGIDPPVFSWFAVASEPAAKPPAPAHQSLTVGSEFVLAKPVNFMPALDPPDPKAVWGQIVQLPAGTKVKVLAVGTKNNAPWYQVTTGERTGWINSVALIGQFD